MRERERERQPACRRCNSFKGSALAWRLVSSPELSTQVPTTGDISIRAALCLQLSRVGGVAGSLPDGALASAADDLTMTPEDDVSRP